MTSPASGSAGYIALPVATDADRLAADAISYLTTQQPGWIAREGHLEVWMLRAFARMAAESAKVAAQVPLSIFQYFGQELLGITPLVGVPAGIQTTWTMTDTLGHTVPAGTTVAYRTAPSSSVLFRTTADVVIPPGAIKTLAGAVPAVAASVGAAANGLPPAQLALVDNLAFVASVESTTTSAGGADPESQQGYLDRLSADLQLLAPRPILPADFAALARNQPGVARAAVLDGYNRSDGSYGNPRMITVVPVDAAGLPLTGPAKDALKAALDRQREVNFFVDVMDPTYTRVDVSTLIIPAVGANPDTVFADAQRVLKDFLSPGNWGGPAPLWHNTPVVRYLALARTLGDVPGVDYVSELTLAAGGALQAADAHLEGEVALPLPGNLNVVVTGATPLTPPVGVVFNANAIMSVEAEVVAGASIDASRFAGAKIQGAGSITASASVVAAGSGGTADDGVQAAVVNNWGPVSFGDEFNYTGKPDASKWGMYDGPGHAGNGIRTPNAFSVANGYCTCHGDAAGNTGGMAFQGHGRRYVRVEMRARMYETNPGSGGNQYHPVLLMWPDSEQWPQGGELDWMETDIGAPGVDAFIHHPTQSGVVQDHYSKTIDITQWHNYAMEWTSTGIRGYIDGVMWFNDTNSSAQPPGPMHQTIQLDNFGGSSHRPANLDVAWFRAYEAG
jgi:hypothetical protein